MNLQACHIVKLNRKGGKNGKNNNTQVAGNEG
jgi:hypothetical protein